MKANVIWHKSYSQHFAIQSLLITLFPFPNSSLFDSLSLLLPSNPKPSKNGSH